MNFSQMYKKISKLSNILRDVRAVLRSHLHIPHCGPKFFGNFRKTSNPKNIID